ncbi:hypothetical protein BCR42DRAFT_328009 [Absidia repens]|uniref:DUF7905 domain-containing protein n=1 Tax=Absidia repens TaxID=90262 RepID=A0A1X2IFN9_9FUNG|nr:hypothetical protein BCR42DRAFT_328009 [Absidia repens]
MERPPPLHTLHSASSHSSSPASTTSSNLNSPHIVRVSGRSISVLDEDYDNDTASNNSQKQSPVSQANGGIDSPRSTPQGPPQYYRGDTESEGESEPENEYTGQFVFAKNIAQPNDVLTGPPLSNRQQSNYLKLIEEDTDTECALVPNSKVVTVTGSTQEAVDDALSRFKQLQTLYKRRGKGPICVPCIHPNPKDSRPFRLYFADLDRYRYKNTVFVASDFRRPLYTLLPVYDDPQTGKPAMPVDLITVSQTATAPRPSPTGMSSPVRQSPTSSRPSSAHPSSSRTVTSPPQQRIAMQENGLPTASWGNRTVTQSGSSIITPEAEQWKSEQQILPTSAPSADPVDDFPTLPTKAAKKPSVQAAGKGMQRRVMRINSQKAPFPAANPSSTTIHEQCRNYNFYNAKLALTEGLENLRGIRGEIKFGAKMGKILWGNLSPVVQSKIWQFQDIKDLAMKENKAVPVFNNVTTTDEQVINTIYGQFPPSYTKTATFEIHAMARNQPSLDYQPIIMNVNPGAVGLQKVVVRNHRASEIHWVSLDRKFDFQMYLNAEELGRIDVKPYSTFLKTMMIDTTNCSMTYDNVENFLKVTHVYYKRTSKHRLHFPFVVEITRVERLPLVPQTFGRILADTGAGDVWYDCEVFYTSHNEFFKRNLDLGIGKIASWTLKDILGEDEEALVDYIKCMVLITENFELQMP